MTRIETVSILHQCPRILLGMKKKKFGEGKYNGFGGGVEVGENAIQGAIRETKEEAGITLLDPILLGKILFEFENGEQDHLVYFIRATEYSGRLIESDEMIPQWINQKNIPYNKMWESDKVWMPLLLQNKEFRGNVLFGKEGDLVRYSIKDW